MFGKTSLALVFNVYNVNVVCVENARRMCVHVRGKMSSVPGSETDINAVSGTAVMPEVSSVGVLTPSSSLKPRVFVKNEMVTSSTSVNITGLEHFTEYMMKVSSAAAAANVSDCSEVSGSVNLSLQKLIVVCLC